MYARISRLAILALALLVLMVPSQAQKAPTPQEQKQEERRIALELFKRMPESTSLLWNSSIITRVAQLDGDDILPLLLAAYLKPPGKPEDNVRYLLAAAIKTRFDIPVAWKGREAGFDRVRAMSESDIDHAARFLYGDGKKDGHIWATFSVAYALAMQNDEAINGRLTDIVRDVKASAFIRAAILEALSRAGVRTVAGELTALIERETKTVANDAVILEACFWAAARQFKPLFKKGEPVDGTFLKIFTAIASKLDDEKAMLPRSRREAALSLQWCFDTKYPYQQGVLWKNIFTSGKDPLREEGNTAASFMGIDALGDRILFLIDASDSMLNPLSADELEGVKKPITGDKRKKNRDEYEIDWSRVRNRFDVAREHCKYTLSRLGKDRQVAVILFGDEARALSVTPSFVPSSSGTARVVMATLDAIAPRPAAEGVKNRPYGTLMGETNYYSALLAAFRMGRSGITKEPVEHWSAKLLTEGADTIFLLSDGAPITDGFSGETPLIEYTTKEFTYHSSQQEGEGYWVDVPARPARPESEYETIDPETGVRTKHKIPAQDATPAQRYWVKITPAKESYRHTHDHGPYCGSSRFGMDFGGGAEMANFLDELERMNLLRKVLVNCVGIGEAHMSWLRPIARAGRGKAVFFGKDGERDVRDRPPPEDFPGDD